jgi:hypothetical protein
MIQKQNAFQMIHLMLQAGGEQSIRFQCLRLAVAIEIFGADLRGPFHIVPDVGNGKAAFLERRHFFRRPDDLRIDEDHGLALALRLRDVHHQHPFGNAHLDGGEPDAVCLIHGFDQVVGQPAHLVIDLFDGLGDGFQARIGRGKDGAYRHGLEIGASGRPVKIKPRKRLKTLWKLHSSPLPPPLSPPP